VKALAWRLFSTMYPMPAMLAASTEAEMTPRKNEGQSMLLQRAHDAGPAKHEYGRPIARHAAGEVE